MLDYGYQYSSGERKPCGENGREDRTRIASAHQVWREVKAQAFRDLLEQRRVTGGEV